MKTKYPKEENFFSSSFCCSMNSSSSPSVSSRARDSIFNYDISLLNQEETVLDLPWISTSDQKEIRIEKKNRKEDEEESEVQRRALGRLRCSILKEWSINSITRLMCGVVCNPLLSSRFALMVCFLLSFGASRIALIVYLIPVFDVLWLNSSVSLIGFTDFL